MSAIPPEQTQLCADHELRRAILPWNGKKWDDTFANARGETLKLLDGAEVQLRTLDERVIQAVWAPAEPETKYSAIFFHGNGMVLDGMAPYAEFFQTHHFNVLLVTMGGYPGSEGNTNELSCYHDVAAAVDHVQKMTGASGKEIIAVGRSLGCALAAQAGAAYGCHAILDLPFRHIVKGVAELAPWLISKCMGLETSANTAFPAEVSDGTFETDSFDNASKAAKIAEHDVSLLVLYADRDEVIPKPKKQAQRIAEAYNNASKERRATVIKLYGGHNDTLFLLDSEAKAQVEGFIQTITDAKD